MSKKDIQDALDNGIPGHDLDAPVVIAFTDGTEDTLPTLRQMLEDQLKLEEFADEMLDKMGFGPRTP